MATINQFWYSLDTIPSFPSYASLSAKSFIDKGHIVHLWTYQDLRNVPNSVVVKGASDILSLTMFLKIANTSMINKDGSSSGKKVNHGNIARAADYFRMKLMYKILSIPNASNTPNGEWWMDSDMLCLKPLPLLPLLDNKITFASCPAKRIGNFAPKNPIKICKEFATSIKEYPKETYQTKSNWDGRDHFTYSAFYVPHTDKAKLILKNIIDDMKDAIDNKLSNMRYTELMHLTKKTLMKYNISDWDVWPPIYFSPLLWCSEKNISKDTREGFTVYGTYQPSFEEIIANTYTVQLYGSKPYIREAMNNPTKMHDNSIIKCIVDEVSTPDLKSLGKKRKRN